MHERELYDRLLGLSAPEFVTDVKLNTAAQLVDVFVEHTQGTSFSYPECGNACPVYDHTSGRQWRHLDSMQFKTMLHARPPRVRCQEHGIKQASLPWAEKNSRFTLLFERFAIDVLQATQTVKGAQGILGTTWDETWHILQRAVARGQAPRQPSPSPESASMKMYFAMGRTRSRCSMKWTVARSKRPQTETTRTAETPVSHNLTSTRSDPTRPSRWT